MAVNPYTLNHLYSNGILDYVPYDLAGGVNVSSLNAMQNPYMMSAMQGSLYQNYGNNADSFVQNSNGIQGYGTQTNAGMNGFGMQGIGDYSHAGMNGFGVQGIGTNSQAGINGFGGGFGGLGQDVSNGVKNTAGFLGSLPNTVKGIASAAILIGAAALCLKGKKKPPVSEGSKWNPVNWFKKTK